MTPVPGTVLVLDRGDGDVRTGTAVHAARLTVDVRRPWPSVLVVRPSGVLDEADVPLVDARVGTPSAEVRHVVVDLRDVAPLTPGGVRALLELDRRTARRGVVLHLAGGSAHELLQRLSDARVLRGAPWCDELL